jgi:hypothetical protein
MYKLSIVQQLVSRGACRLHPEGKQYLIVYAIYILYFYSIFFSSTLKVEATHSSETSVYNRSTRRPIPEGGILQTYIIW